MRPQLPEILGALDGTELYALAQQLARATTTAAAAAVNTAYTGHGAQQAADMLGDLAEVRDDVLAQFARIPVPIDRARRIIEASAFGRGRVIPVAGAN